MNVSKKKPARQVNNPGHDFSLNSGERQTGINLADIRYDHKVRYDFSINYIKDNLPDDQSYLGLDIFCGTGYGTYMFSNSLKCPMLGIDGSEDAVAFANTHYQNEQTLYAHKLFPFEPPVRAGGGCRRRRRAPTSSGRR